MNTTHHSILLSLLVVILSVIVSVTLCACPHTTYTDKWSNHAEWSRTGANVVISADSVVLLDTSTDVIRSVDVFGTLVFSDRDLELKMNWMRVRKGGKLLIGSEDCPITSKVFITMFGDRTKENVIGNDPSDNGAFGAKGIAAETGSVVEIHGQVKGVMWTRLAQTAYEGSNKLVLQEKVSWQTGDSIVIASTDFHELKYKNSKATPASIRYLHGRSYFPDQNERGTVQSVSGNIVTLNEPLKYTHWGTGYERAEIGLLTRRIVIRGDTNEQFGGHLLMRRADRIKISGVEFDKMGQSGVVGRYPIHYHLQGNRYGDNIYIKSSSVHDSFQRCIVVHDTNGVLVENNVAFNNTGHCYFLEDGGEVGNIFNRNLGVLVLPVAEESGRQIIPTDIEPSIFWLTNPNNTITNNAAVGGIFGFWYVMPEKPIGLSKAKYENDNGMKPRNIPLGKFDSNVAHSCFDTGLMVDEMIDPNGKSESAKYSPLVKDEQVDARFTNFIAYKNRRHGVWARGIPLVFSNMVLLDNLIGFNAPPGQTILEHSIIVGESDNKGLPTTADGERERPRPGKSRAYETIRGFESYDNGGPQYAKNVTFINFVSNSIRKAGALAMLHGAPFALHPRNKLAQLKFENANQVYINRTEDFNADGYSNINWMDVDGSAIGKLNGVNGGWIVSNNPVLTFDGCQYVSEWNAYKCPYFPGNYVQLELKDNGPKDSNNPEKIVAEIHMPGTGKKNGIYSRMDDGDKLYMSNLRSRHTYAYKFNDGRTPGNLDIRLHGSTYGDYIYLAIPYPRTTTLQVSRNKNGSKSAQLTKVNSVQQLADTTYFFDPNTQFLFLRLRNNKGNSYSERWGFVDYKWDGYQYNIKAGCGSGCIVNDWTLPAPIADTDQQYTAKLEPLQQSGQPISDGTGVGFFFLTTSTREFQIIVNHDRLAATDFIMEERLDNGQVRGIKISTSPLQPVRTIVTLTPEQVSSLRNGDVFVTIATAKYPKGELIGQLYWGK